MITVKGWTKSYRARTCAKNWQYSRNWSPAPLRLSIPRRYATHVPIHNAPTPHRRAAVTPYRRILKRFEDVRRILGKRSLTLAEKILYSHLDHPEESLLSNPGNGKN